MTTQKNKLGDIVYNEKGEDTGERTSPDPWLMRALKQGGAGLIEGFGATLPTLYGLAGAGYEYATSDNKDLTFGEAMLSPEGRVRVRNLDASIAKDIFERNPGITDQEVNDRLMHIKKHSKKYYDQVTPHFRSGISFGRDVSRFAQDTVNDPRLPTERTQLDTLYNIVGSSGVPLPGAVGAKAAQVLTRPAATAGQRAAKVGLNALELTTPVTVPYTAGRVAANIGVQEGIDQTFRITNDQPSVVEDAWNAVPLPRLTKDNGDADWKGIAVTGVGAAGTILAAMKLKQIVTKPQGGPTYGPSAQQTIQDNNVNPEPMSQRVANLGSDTGAPLEYLRGAGVDGAPLRNAQVELEFNSGSMPTQIFENIYERGLLPDGRRIKPLNDTALEWRNSDDGFKNAVSDYINIRNRLHDEGEALSETNRSLAETTAKLQKAQNATTPNPTLIGRLTQEVADLNSELRARATDADPNLRPNLMGLSSQDARTRLASLQQNPKVIAMAKDLTDYYDAVNFTLAREGLISAAEAGKMRQHLRNGLTHLEDNPFNGKSWLQQKYMQYRGVVDPLSVYSEGRKDLFRGHTERVYRKGYLDDTDKRVTKPNQQGMRFEPRPNTPYDPFTNAALFGLRASQAIAANRAKRSFVHQLIASPNNRNGEFGKIVERIPAHTIGARATEINTKLEDYAKGKLHIGHFENGDYVLTNINSPIVKRSFDFAPTATVPLLSGLRKTIQTTLTGALNPPFAMVSVPWDGMMGVFFRDPKLVFGPISGAAARLFGRESYITRAISTASAPVDLAVILARLPVVATKRLMIEAFGPATEQLGKSIQQQLASQSGFFGSLASLPGGNLVIGKVASSMAKAYHSSWTYAMKEMRIGHTNILLETDKLMKQVTSLEKGATAEAKAVWNGYKSLLSVVHDTAKELFLSQNMKQFKRELRAGQHAIPDDIQKWIVNETRKIGGDFQRHSGNNFISSFMSTVPYGNVMLQSNRYIIDRARKHPKDVFGKLLMGAVLPVLYGNHYISTWGEEGANWLWNEQPPDRRMQHMYLPRPDIWFRRQMGEDIPFKPEYVLPIRMAPEMIILSNPMMHALLGLGFFPNATKGAIVPPDVNRDLSGALDQVFGLSLPFVAGPAAALGYEIKPGAIMRGDNAIRELRTNNFQGANKDKISAGSAIPRSFYDVVNAVFGVNMANMVAAANVAHETFKRTGDTAKSLKDAGDTALLKRQASLPMSNMLFPSVTRNYVYTPISDELNKNMAVLRQVHGQYANEPMRMMNPRSRRNRVDDVRGEEMAAVAAPVDDPNLAAILNDVRNGLFSGKMTQLDRERQKLTATREGLQRGTSATGTPLQRYKREQEITKQINDLDRDRYDLYQYVWSDIQSQYSTIFAKSYQEPLSPQSLLKAVQMSSRRATLAPAPVE